MIHLAVLLGARNQHTTALAQIIASAAEPRAAVTRRPWRVPYHVGGRTRLTSSTCLRFNSFMISLPRFRAGGTT